MSRMTLDDLLAHSGVSIDVLKNVEKHERRGALEELSAGLDLEDADAQLGRWEKELAKKLHPKTKTSSGSSQGSRSPSRSPLEVNLRYPGLPGVMQANEGLSYLSTTSLPNVDSEHGSVVEQEEGNKRLTLNFHSVLTR